MAKAPDLTGMVFTRLTVIERRGNNKDRTSLWLCECECGNKKIIRSSSLKSGATKSCGCLQREQSKVNGQNNWTGCGEISGYHWSDIKKSAKKRNLKVSVSIEQAWNVFISQNKKCALSGQRLFFARNQYKDIRTASLDRIDAKIDYQLDNIQWIHKDINCIKNSLDQNKFLDLCHKVVFFSENDRCRDLDKIEEVVKLKLKPRCYLGSIPIIEPQKRNVDNITGTKFGRYTIMEKSKSAKGKYICECECGVRKEVYLCHLKNGGTVSCGCYGKEVDYTSYHGWKGYEEISGAYWNSLKDCARRRKINFNLTFACAWDQFIKQNRQCALTGEKICFIRNYGRKKTLQTASLDRINSKLNYEKNNIQWIHKDINKLKWNFEQDYFIEMCKMVSNYNKKPTIIQL